MKNQLVTEGIILSRIDFGEADRIVTVLTPDNGKIKAIAKGVRRPKSKLAGGIELLSTNNLTILSGKGDLGTVISSRLISHYGNIVTDMQRTMFAYDLLKKVNRTTEDASDEDYYWLLQRTLQALDDGELAIELIELWFCMQLLHIAGHAPNLQTDVDANPLDRFGKYEFDFDQMAFKFRHNAPYDSRHIKLMRLSHSVDHPLVLKNIADASQYTGLVLRLVTSLADTHVHL